MDAALRLIKRGQTAEARQRLEPVVASHPGWGRAHFYLALTYHEEQRYAEAEGLFRRALELDPEYAPPRVFFGWCLYYLGKLPEARKMFESYRTTAPEYADAHYALGLIDFDEDNLESASTRFLQTIELAQKQHLPPTESKARARLADVMIRSGDLQHAKEELLRSIALNPDNYETYFKLSRVLQRLGDAAGAEKARNDYEEAFRRSRAKSPPSEPGKKP